MVKRSLLYKSILIVLITGLFYSFTSDWGFQGHKVINNKAVYGMPSNSLFRFYKENIEYLTEHAIDPDKRRHSDKDEAPRHYIDIDHYASKSESPFALMPRNWNDAKEKYSEDTLLLYGIVPWHVMLMSHRLTEAFKEKDKEKILRLSAEIGHYIADACVPLHTTLNYDGQMTGQKGVHSFWETRLVELYIDDYDLLCDQAFYIDDQEDFIWTIIEESFSNVKPLLDAERNASSSLADDQKFVIDDKNGYESMLPSKQFSQAFNQELDGMVEERMRRSIVAVSSFWYTAWVNAGQPNVEVIE